MDGEILPVATTPTTRNGEGGAPQLEPSLPSARPGAGPAVAILPFPLSVAVEGRRDPAGALSLARGPPEAARAWEAAMGLAGRLVPSAPPLFARAGTIACTARQADMAAESYRIDFAHDFLQQVQEILRGLGRGLGAWEEAALGGGVGARDTYLVAWREAVSGIALAQQGYDVVLAPGQTYYLDMAQSDDWWEPGASWAGTVTPERCYAFDPGGDWPQHLQARLLGVQACLWSEVISDRKLFDHLTFPRLSAVAESAWTMSTRKDFARFCALQGLMPRTGIG